jgi:hypothetical protein
MLEEERGRSLEVLLEGLERPPEELEEQGRVEYLP